MIQWGPELTENPVYAAQTHFNAYALGGVDAHGPSDQPKIYTLQSLMAMNGARSLKLKLSFLALVAEYDHPHRS